MIKYYVVAAQGRPRTESAIFPMKNYCAVTNFDICLRRVQIFLHIYESNNRDVKNRSRPCGCSISNSSPVLNNQKFYS